jgi:hypothetical protein
MSLEQSVTWRALEEVEQASVLPGWGAGLVRLGGNNINKKASKPQIGRLFCRVGETLYSLTVKMVAGQAYT